MMETYIQDFCDLTVNDASVCDLAPFLMWFKKSSILNTIMKDPQNVPALMCLKTFVMQNPRIPQIFVSRFIAVTQTKIRVTPTRFSASQIESCAATVIQSAVKPPRIITNLTASAMRNALRQDSRNSQRRQRNPDNCPATVRVRLTPEILSECVKANVDYYRTIDEGNRANGLKVDPYVKHQIKKL